MSIEVSEEFMFVYSKLNCFSVSEKFTALNEKEKLLLILAAIDNHDIDDDVVFSNIQHEKKLLNDLLDVLEGRETTNEEIKNITNNFSDKSLNDVMISFNSNEWKISEMPTPATKDEVRDARINKISE
jgi:hypothetical protein